MGNYVFMRIANVKQLRLVFFGQKIFVLIKLKLRKLDFGLAESLDNDNYFNNINIELISNVILC